MSVEAISWPLNLATVPADRGGRPSSACKFVHTLLYVLVDEAGRWLTLRLASQLTGLTPHGIRARCRRGRPAAARQADGTLRISAADVAEYRK